MDDVGARSARGRSTAAIFEAPPLRGSGAEPTRPRERYLLRASQIPAAWPDGIV